MRAQEMVHLGGGLLLEDLEALFCLLARCWNSESDMSESESELESIRAADFLLSDILGRPQPSLKVDPLLVTSQSHFFMCLSMLSVDLLLHNIKPYIILDP